MKRSSVSTVRKILVCLNGPQDSLLSQRSARFSSVSTVRKILVCLNGSQDSRLSQRSARFQTGKHCCIEIDRMCAHRMTKVRFKDRFERRPVEETDEDGDAHSDCCNVLEDLQHRTRLFIDTCENYTHTPTPTRVDKRSISDNNKRLAHNVCS